MMGLAMSSIRATIFRARGTPASSARPQRRELISPRWQTPMTRVGERICIGWFLRGANLTIWPLSSCFSRIPHWKAGLAPVYYLNRVLQMDFSTPSETEFTGGFHQLERRRKDSPPPLATGSECPEWCHLALFGAHAAGPVIMRSHYNSQIQPFIQYHHRGLRP